jgi:Protein of unknown function (DUF4012)
VELSAVQAAGVPLERAYKSLTAARSIAAGAPSPHFGALESALEETRERVNEGALTASKATKTFQLLPDFLGAEGRRRYLLVFQSLSEQRGTGGLMGLVGVLRADDGKVALESVDSFDHLFPFSMPEVRAPEWFESRYGALSSTREWRQANFSPSFPTVARVLLRMYAAAQGRHLDGVLTMDPVALGQMMRGTGPIETTDPNLELTTENVRRVLLHDIYEGQEDQAAQNAFLTQVIDSFWNRVRSGDLDPGEFASGLGEAAATQHLKLFSADETDESRIEDLRVGGGFTAYGPNVQLVYHDNLGANKVDYFLRRDIDTSVSLSNDGTATVNLDVQMTNGAPNSPDSVLLGPYKHNAETGVNRMYFNVVLPKDAVVQRYSRDGKSLRPLVEDEDGFPVMWDLFTIEPGATAEASLTYRVRRAVDLDVGKTSFDFFLVPQPAVVPDTFSFQARAPEGWHFEGFEDHVARQSGTLDRPWGGRFVLVRD